VDLLIDFRFNASFIFVGKLKFCISALVNRYPEDYKLIHTLIVYHFCSNYLPSVNIISIDKVVCYVLFMNYDC